MRAKVWLKLNRPLVSGCFLECKNREAVWIDFRYEGVFNFCKRCGRIGHDMIECMASWSNIQRDIMEIMVEVSDATITYAREYAPMYTNKIRGLPNCDVFKSTLVNTVSKNGGKYAWSKGQ